MRRIEGLGWSVVLVCTACATSRPTVVEAPVDPAAASQSRSTARRYVDEDLGFEIVRSTAEWQLDETGEDNSPDGMTIPIVLRHRTSGAQVMLQVAPAVATPTQLAERMTLGLREHPGFVASEPEPLPLSDSAVGFNFQMGNGLRGRVAVTEGSPGRVFMMLATWPEGASEEVSRSVEALFGAVRPLPAGGTREL